METKVKAMNCIETYLQFRLRCGQNLYIVYKHESFYTLILQKMLMETKKDLHFCKSCVEHSGFIPLLIQLVTGSP